jgi:hypothetical protein
VHLVIVARNRLVPRRAQRRLRIDQSSCTFTISVADLRAVQGSVFTPQSHLLPIAQKYRANFWAVASHPCARLISVQRFEQMQH